MSHLDRQAIQLGAYLHDIGKIGLEDRLLSGKSQASNQEDELLKCHPIIGERMMNLLPFPKEVGQIIRHHHERYNGTGYPDGLRGEEIPLAARIVGLANQFDNLVTGRLHEGPLPVTEAREHIRRDGGAGLDPKLVDIFAKVVW